MRTLVWTLRKTEQMRGCRKTFEQRYESARERAKMICKLWLKNKKQRTTKWER